MTSHPRLWSLDDYAALIGEETAERIRAKAHRLHGLRVVNVSSTFYGGGVAELLSSLTLLERALGLRADWRLIQGSPDFFSVTKKLHNALQGGAINLTELKKGIYEEIAFHNALRMDLSADAVIVHDPQPLPLVRHFRRTCPWIWRCHLDLSHPLAEAWEYVRPLVEEYDAVVLSLPEYRREIPVPQYFIMPAIDPFTVKNREMTRAEIGERLSHHEIPTDLPIVAQIARFDHWKDPRGVIEAFHIARRTTPATLVLLGNVATDDPEGQEVFESLLECKEERVLILTAEDSALVNALQRRASVVLQKSLREGFGLTVAEAMWKGTAVIGGDCGGIRHQITDGEDGFLVRSVQEAGARIAQLLADEALRARLGAAARQTVRKRYLLSRMLEQELDLLEMFEPRFAPDARRTRSSVAPAARRGHEGENGSN